LATVLGGPLVIALPLAVFIATLTVALASLVRLVFSCSLERSLVAAVAWICVLYISLSLLGGLSSKFNQRIGRRSLDQWHAHSGRLVENRLRRFSDRVCDLCCLRADEGGRASVSLADGRVGD
jgi:hypothetical protein